jgi:AcrR family transcriptional regulator
VNCLPKKFTETERQYIIKRLKEEALKCIAIYGIKKTTVDELVKRVNIPKGTFYLLYASKELLLFDAINDLHDEIHNQLLKEVASITEKLTCDSLTDFLFHICVQVNHSGLLSLLLNDEMEYLMRRLPEATVKDHQVHDDFTMEKLFSLLPIKGEKKIEAFSGAFRGIFMTMLYKREIGEQIFEEALRLMIRGIVIQLMEDE